MGQKFDAISEKHQSFIEAQKIFFVGTATQDSHVNISPKRSTHISTLFPVRAKSLICKLT